MNDYAMFLTEGTLDEFLSAPSGAGLMQRVKDRSQQKGVSSAARAALGQIHEALSAGGAPSESETMHFAALLGGRVVYGGFEEAHNLQAGDRVSAVVSKQGDPLYVHSLHRISDNLFLLPSDTLCGNGAFFNRCMTDAWRMTKLNWLFFGTLFVIALVSSGGEGHFLFMALFVLLGPPLLMFPMEYWTYRTLGPNQGYAKAILETYGIPHADEFDAMKGFGSFTGRAGVFFAPNYADAMRVHRKKFDIAV